MPTKPLAIPANKPISNSIIKVVNDIYNRKKERVGMKNISEYTYDEYKLMERYYLMLLDK